MTILRISNRHLDRKTYAAIDQLLDIARHHPPGLIMHGASEVDGEVVVAQVWDSAEYADRFAQEHLHPACDTVGAPVEAEVMTFELHHLVTP
jgi:hypothetical protein